MDTQSDEQIVLRIRKGDKELFGVLIDRYEAKLTRYIKRFLQNEEDITDIVQNVFIKVFVNLQSFDVDRTFNSWIYRIAHNETVTYLKKRGNEKVSFLDFDTMFPHPFAKETADKGTLDKELEDLMTSSLSLIPLKYKEVLVLYYYEELSYQEIADVLHIPIATVGVRLRRGREQLEKHIKKEDHI
ncbi:MAG: RNA polymerase sigma factor [Candidatus Nomurabacteria bacterium]|nr:RNA polymerase sigma factor [Candidatus Nomurabacteria bacterium]